ncbi:MAG: hypothetical protein H7837_13045 [Magnetococcus sp. MYC-9]
MFKNFRILTVIQPQQPGWLERCKRQALGLVSLLLGIFLGIPGVPGPGFVFIALAVLLLDFPGKQRLISLLQHKRWFRIARVVIRKKMNVLLVMPKNAPPVEMV